MKEIGESVIRKIKTATIKDQPWSIRWVKKVDNNDSLGECVWQDRQISVQLGQPALELIDTLIHESLHAEFPEATEEAVAIAAKDITAILRRCGMLKFK